MEVLSIVGAVVVSWVLFRVVSFVVRLLFVPATNVRIISSGPLLMTRV